MKRAIILGCSHAAGSEIPNGIACSYPVKIAEQLGYIPENYAIAGGSNDAMFRIYEEQCTSLDSSDIVIACWSGCNRTEIWNDTNKDWQPLAPGKQDISPKEYLDYQEQWITYHTDSRIGRLNKIKNIVALNSLAMQQHIQVINIDSFWPITDIAWTPGMYWPLNDNFWDWCNSNNYPHTNWGHFFEPAHQAFAEVLTEKCKMWLTDHK
jgi:hypothetical protein